jgi:hypothetical protein
LVAHVQLSQFEAEDASGGGGVTLVAGVAAREDPREVADLGFSRLLHEFGIALVFTPGVGVARVRTVLVANVEPGF